MKNVRVIYMIEEFTRDGELTCRRFARNKKTAERIARGLVKPYIHRLRKYEWQFVDFRTLEG